MIAKIGKGSNMYGAILYNQQKVDKENGMQLNTLKRQIHILSLLVLEME